jgi:hypothetical protein
MNFSVQNNSGSPENASPRLFCISALSHVSVRMNCFGLRRLGFFLFGDMAALRRPRPFSRSAASFSRRKSRATRSRRLSRRPEPRSRHAPPRAIPSARSTRSSRPSRRGLAPRAPERTICRTDPRSIIARISVNAELTYMRRRFRLERRSFILKSRMPQSEYAMNIFYIIGVVVVIIFVAGFFGLHA